MEHSEKIKIRRRVVLMDLGFSFVSTYVVRVYVERQQFEAGTKVCQKLRAAFSTPNLNHITILPCLVLKFGYELVFLTVLLAIIDSVRSGLRTLGMCLRPHMKLF